MQTRSQKNDESKTTPQEINTTCIENSNAMSATETETSATATKNGGERDREIGNEKEGTKSRTTSKRGIDIWGNTLRSETRDKSVSVTSRASARKRADLEAQLELQMLKMKEAQAAAEHAATKLKLLRLREQSETDLSEEEQEEAASQRRVADWVDQSSVERRQDSIHGARSKEVVNKGERPEEATPTQPSSETQTLASAILEAIKASNKSAIAPKYLSELHTFDGDLNEWVAFKTTYEDTAQHFTDVQNISRLRKAIHGSAQEAVKALLYTQTDPALIITALERRFGRPTYIIKNEIANIDRLPQISESAKEIVKFAGVVANTVATIKKMNKPNYLHSSDISERIIEKMSAIIRFRWFEYHSAAGDVPILIALANFLNVIADQYALHDTGTKYHMKKEVKYKSKRVHATRKTETTESSDDEAASATVAFQKHQKEACQMCNQEHSIKECTKFLKLSVDERWDLVKKNNVCFKCLKIGRHRGYNCKARGCSTCKRRHHTLLHSDGDPLINNEPKIETVSSVNAIAASKAYLKIAPVEVYGPKGKKMIYALLDEGSTITLLEENVANDIGADGPRDELHLEGVGGQKLKNKSSKKLQLRIKGLYAREYENLCAYTMEELRLSPQAVRKQEVRDCAHLSDMLEEITYDAVKPSLLIGQDNWHLIVSREVRSGRPSQPVVSLTKLGWVLHGCSMSISQPLRQVNHLCTRDDHLEDLIKSHFSIESMGVAPKKPVNDPEERALKILSETCRVLPSKNRYECGLLWKSEKETMPESRTNALKRFMNIEKRMKSNKEFKEEYMKQIDNLIQNGYAEIAPSSSKSPREWYLPHFAVTHPQKKKIRVVFDAAAKSNGKCLNDALLSGPDLLQSLFGVLIRFREGPIAVMADIKEMFLRVQIREEDRDSQRFLWRENDNLQVKEYRMTSLIFGATSSPCSAIYVKNKNAENEERDPEATIAIKKHHYMDDYLQSFYNPSTAKKIATEVDRVHKRGGFVLRGWASNDPTVIKHFPEVQSSNQLNLGGNELRTEKTLGLKWNTPREIITGYRPPTKREVTSAVMSVFDPLGLACPVLIQGKQIIQSIWRSGIGWDEPLKDQEEQLWRKWIQHLKGLSRLEVPRCISPIDTEGELHTFCDASEKAFSAAVYWRYRNDGDYKINLIAGKSKVAPNKPISIPRLELQAALLGSRLAQSIQQELSTKRITRRIFWSDSRTALSWIKSDPRIYKTYVSHRIAEIEQLTRQSEWRWTPTKDNVADDATREPPSTFDASHRWFCGPTFLTLEESDWPKPESRYNLPVTGEERTKENVNIIISRPSSLPSAERFSTWERLLHATARLFQCVEKFKSLRKTHVVNIVNKKTKDSAWRKHVRKRKSRKENTLTRPSLSLFLPPLDVGLIAKAENELIKEIQKDCFYKEIMTLKENKQLEKSSRP